MSQIPGIKRIYLGTMKLAEGGDGESGDPGSSGPTTVVRDHQVPVLTDITFEYVGTHLDAKITLTWNNPPDGESTVYRSTSTIDPYNLPSVHESIGSANEYVEEISEEGTYHYRVNNQVDGVNRVSNELEVTVPSVQDRNQAPENLVAVYMAPRAPVNFNTTLMGT